jgi:hypothetical protein
MAGRRRGASSRLDLIKSSLIDDSNRGGDLEAAEDSFGGRSEVQASEVSSDLFRPKWSRLLLAAGELLASKVQGTDGSATMARQEDYFPTAAGMGGGSNEDIAGHLKMNLESLQLSEEDKGHVLVSAYHYLQASDLVLSAMSWRCLLTVALIAAVETVTKGSPDGRRAEGLIRDRVAHWWPRSECEKAHEAFVTRPDFIGQLPPSLRASRYFELRDWALKMGYNEDSFASAVQSFSHGGIADDSNHGSHNNASRGFVVKDSRRSGGGSHNSSSHRSLLEFSEASSESWASDHRQQDPRQVDATREKEKVISI